MILLDTHIWVWWVDESPRLSEQQHMLLQTHQPDGLGVSIMSCWEVAKLVEYQRLKLACPVEQWISGALAQPGVQPVDLTTRIVIESTQLPGKFHRDPVDQLLVATARVYDLALVTTDRKIIQYEHVHTL